MNTHVYRNERIPDQHCYALNINKKVHLRELIYVEGMKPEYPCDNFLCKNHPECIHNSDNRNFHGNSIDYLIPPKQPKK